MAFLWLFVASVVFVSAVGGFFLEVLELMRVAMIVGVAFHVASRGFWWLFSGIFGVDAWTQCLKKEKQGKHTHSIVMLTFSSIQRQIVEEADKVQHPIEKKQHASSRITWTCMYKNCGAVYHWDSFQTFSGLGKLTVERAHVLQTCHEISEPDTLRLDREVLQSW